MMQRRSSLVAVCLVLLFGIVFVSTGTQTYRAAQATQSVPEKSHYIGFVPPSFTDPVYVEMADGVRTLAAKRGWKFEVYAPVNAADVASQALIIRQFIEKGVEAISVNAIDVDTMTAGVKIANASHVPFFVHNSLTPLSDSTAQVAA